MASTNGNLQLHQPRARKHVKLDQPDLHDIHGRATSDPLLRDSSPAAALRDSNGRATSTPTLGESAPPSLRATAAARQVKRQTRKRMFPTVDYESRVAYFDQKSDFSDFRGFFVLFWIGLVIMVITAMLRNLKETGWLLSFKQLPLFKKDLFELGVSDAAMCASTALSLPLHQLYRAGPRWLRWQHGGFWIQSVFQILWLVFWCTWPYVRDWTWTAQVFFTLHLLAMLMKIHSYAFYNGHLAWTLGRLQKLDRPARTEKSTEAAVKYPQVGESPFERQLEPQSHEVAAISQVRDDLAMELVSPLGNVTYPQNLTYANFWDYLLCPTLCYELEYPRTPGISWSELFINAAAVFGCVFLMAITSDEFILPVLDESAIALYRPGIGRVEQALILAETVSRLLFPFMVAFLLTFLTIFQYSLTAFAEITCFADRYFYSDWWNSADWLDFSRKWNRPVHLFLQRHVYSASRTLMSKPMATAITFLISALAHELVMVCISRKWRGYGAFLLFLQVPFASIQRSPWVRQKRLLNNVLFWCSMVLGPSLMCALYVLV